MKNNLENSIKESLKGYELPYDPSAWEAMSKKLDKVMPVSPKSNLKWYLGGAATVAVIVTTIALWPADKSTSMDNVKTAQNELNTANRNVNGDNTSLNATNNKSGKTNTVSQDASVNNIEVANDVNPVKQILNEVNIITPLNVNNSNQNINQAINPISYTGITPITSKKIEIVDISNICLGESISIVNKNDINLTLLDPNGSKTIVKSNKTTSITPELEGKYAIGYTENGELTSKSFNVMPSPNADFTIDDKNIYEKGLPTVNVSTNSIGNSYLWDFGKQTENGAKEASVHYFKKGNYTISLTVEGSNGCKSKVSQTVEIVDNYNLMAVLWLDLSNSTGSAYNSFMPYALTQRQVDFKMKIIDLKDGGIVFETTDSSDEWKGIDRRTGQLVEKDKAFMWTVSLNNPEKGEKSEYTGSVTTK
ncbi:MAG: hypothetical protein RI883_965 [Bacteroidota bacterium]|jgi:hypothetical protein